MGSVAKRLIAPLQSRKVRVALATVIAALLLEFGVDVSETVLLGVIGIGASVVLGIAVEDAGEKSAGK